jgi:predicted PhzF superfamily epimerase YddE/YHI9
MGRRGRVHISQDIEAVWVGGDAVTSIEGHIEI